MEKALDDLQQSVAKSGHDKKAVSDFITKLLKTERGQIRTWLISALARVNAPGATRVVAKPVK